ncbi:AAA family ATPase [Arachidicoccus terrestris]|uniref:AAA family ATPase n=1 Tax=Arachidicoccus terrestris TaxID=2875539 RepID=UPI001CC4381A|nr:ATP-binding protein [Arachidicoccus terrestris]UAY55488.1 AAA family ATPase [Arachidicoccus terrestris]
MKNLIGRIKEQELLKEAFDSGHPELIAVFGRRRVGKTYLIRKYFKDKLLFQLVGTKDASLSSQLAQFSTALGNAAGNPRLFRVPESWSEAFSLLSNFLTPKLVIGRSVVFLDEFPWLNTQKSGFLQAFDHWWNSWANDQDNLVVIICGSAASWMIKNVVNNKGGLHNRITRKIRLLPFSLKETEEFLLANNINMVRYQILQIYMVMGGIPQYLKEIRKGESPEQAINRICFTKDGFLSGEFNNLYHSLFDDASRHLSIIRVLADNNSGLTRKDIIEKAGLSSGGTLTLLFDELIESGFVTTWLSYDRKSKDLIYKLSDEFTHFYLKFMEGHRGSGDQIWETLSTEESWKIWSGIAFERVCLKHIPQIKISLGIRSIYTEEATWHFKSANGKGAQIDLLFDRKDFVISLCEIKFSKSEFAITKAYAEQLENKKEVFKEQTKTKKALFLTFVTAFGLTNNNYAKRLVQNSITMDALFEK